MDTLIAFVESPFDASRVRAVIDLLEWMLKRTIIDESLITRETTFESIGIDSLDTVDLVIDLEEAFHIIIERDETIETVGELVDIIDELSCQEG